LTGSADNTAILDVETEDMQEEVCRRLVRIRRSNGASTSVEWNIEEAAQICRRQMKGRGQHARALFDWFRDYAAFISMSSKASSSSLRR
jgi:hypothetical protein